MKKIVSFVLFFLLITFVVTPFSSLAHAADVRTGNYIAIPEDEENLSDLYLFGKNVEVAAPVSNDLVAAGGSVLVKGDVDGSLMAAGGTVRLSGNTAGSVRAAGGDVIIDGTVGRDLVVAGGSVTLAKNATVGGDLLVTGGQLTIDGTVNGSAKISGGEVEINGTIKQPVEARVETLTLGSTAVLGSNLKYASPQKATIENSASVAGETSYKQVEYNKKAPPDISGFLSGILFYKLITDIILSVALIYFFGAFIKQLLAGMTTSPLKKGFYGFVFLLVVPLLSLFLIVLIWLGIVSFLFYALVLIVSVFIAKIFIGWGILRWWYGRNKKQYLLDWKAGVLGPIVLLLIGLIPFVGWLFLSLLYLVSVGALLSQISSIVSAQKLPARKK